MHSNISIVENCIDWVNWLLEHGYWSYRELRGWRPYHTESSQQRKAKNRAKAFRRARKMKKEEHLC
jgi:hypothetical protein